jgi:glycerol-3-phosphate acyltransferase PlsY
MVAVTAPVAAGVGAVVFVSALASSRIVSLSSLLAAFSVPLVALLVGAPSGEVVAFLACAVVVAARHRDNLVRLRHGEEPRLRRVLD